MRRSSSILLLLLFLLGCSSGGSGGGGTTAAPAPGPQRVSLKVQVGLDGLARQIQARGPLSLVVAEAVNANSSGLDPGTLSGLIVAGSGSAGVEPQDTRALITLDLAPGVYDIYVFGLDADGKVVAHIPSPVHTNLLGGEAQAALVQLETGVSAGVTVTPSNTSLPVGSSLSFSALVRFLDNSTSTSVVWSSSDPAVATIDPTTGVATGLTPGTVTLTATSTDDPTLSGSATLVVLPASVTISSLTLAATPLTLNVGQTGNFTVTANLSDGTTQDVTASAAYTANPGTALTIASDGSFTAIAAGAVSVTATFQSVTSNAVSLTVNALTQERVVVVTLDTTSTIETYLLDSAGGLGSMVDTHPLTSTAFPDGSGSGLGADAGNNLVFTPVQGNGVDTFQISSTGAITSLGNLVANGAQVATGANGFLYIAENGGPGNDGIDTWSFSGGVFNFVSNYTATQDNIQDLLPSPPPGLNQFLYSAGATSQTVQGYPLSPTGPPTGAPLPGTASTLPASASRLAQLSDGSLLFVGSDQATAGTIGSYALAVTGDINPVALSLSTLNGQFVKGVAVSPDDRFLYVLSRNTSGVGQVQIFSILPGGVLSEDTAAAFSIPNSVLVHDMALDPSGKFMLVTGFGDSTLRVYGVDQTSGAVNSTPLTTIPVNRAHELVILP